MRIWPSGWAYAQLHSPLPPAATPTATPPPPLPPPLPTPLPPCHHHALVQHHLLHPSHQCPQTKPHHHPPYRHRRHRHTTTTTITAWTRHRRYRWPSQLPCHHPRPAGRLTGMLHFGTGPHPTRSAPTPLGRFATGAVARRFGTGNSDAGASGGNAALPPSGFEHRTTCLWQKCWGLGVVLV